MTDRGDLCPKCGKPQLPPWKKDSKQTARACLACGYVEEKPVKAADKSSRG